MSDHFRLLRDLSAVREIVTLLMLWLQYRWCTNCKWRWYHKLGKMATKHDKQHLGSKGQTLKQCIIDIGKLPTGELTPFNIYVALSRSRGWDIIQLLQDFEDRLFTQHPSEYLRQEDQWLVLLDEETREWWLELLARRNKIAWMIIITNDIE